MLSEPVNGSWGPMALVIGVGKKAKAEGFHPGDLPRLGE